MALSAADYWDEIDAECFAVLETAQQEYASETDRFQNFHVIGGLLGLSPRQVLSVYLLKHVLAVAKGVSLREPIRGRVIDAIGYLKLLAYMDYLEQDNLMETCFGNGLGQGMGN